MPSIRASSAWAMSHSAMVSGGARSSDASSYPYQTTSVQQLERGRAARLGMGDGLATSPRALGDVGLRPQAQVEHRRPGLQIAEADPRSRRSDELKGPLRIGTRKRKLHQRRVRD